MKELIKRHFASPGFKKRLKYIYIPLAKRLITYFYNRYKAKKEKDIYTKVYKDLNNNI